MIPRRAAPSRIRIAGWLTVAVFLALIARFWHPVFGFTAFLQLDATNDDVKLAAFRELPVYVYRDTGGYDGLYYAQIALDPTLRDPALPAAMDNFSYRARRILPPALAWMLGGGRPPWVIAAYSLVNVAAWLVLAALLWRTIDVRDGRGWIAWSGVLFSAGALCSVRLALTDLAAATLVTASLLAAEAERKRTALGCLAGAALARETSLLAVAGLTKSPWFSFKNAARIVLAALPLALWLGYVRWRAGPADPGWGNLTWPIAGFIEKWRDVARAIAQLDDPWLAWTSALAMLGLTVQAGYLAFCPQPAERWWRVGFVYVVLMLCLGTAVWEGHPGAALRVLLPLTLAFNVVAHRRRAALVWLIVGNLGVGAGLLSLRDVPTDAHELAAVRRGSVAGIVDIGPGWYGREETSRHHWSWARQSGQLQLETWPKLKPATLRLQFGLRGLTPRTVVLRQDGREIWRAEVGMARTNYSVDVTVAGGHATLEFSSDAPAIRENDTPIARELGFALYDLRLDVPKP